ncbi:MAG: SdpI family protein [Blautia sp.]|nr:SdpI family protein [Blautia sp.]
MFTLVLWLFPVLSLVANVAIYSANLGYHLEMSRMVNILLGVLFIIIGNYLPKARQNYSIGIRIPWTLANEDNWNRTHRFAGFLWVIGGLLIVLLSFINFLPGYWFVSIILVIALVPCLYSFWLHVKQ